MDKSRKMTISLVLNTYNEEGNIIPLVENILDILSCKFYEYNYEIIIIDNNSIDKTREKIEKLCSKSDKIKAIFNARDFGQFNSSFYGLCQTSGDCTIVMASDFQDPPEMIPEFIKEWENGYKVVITVKTSSKESRLMYFLRTCYYSAIKAFSPIEQVKHFTGFGLYDRAVVDELRKLNDPLPFFRGMIAELGFVRKEIQYEQQKRRSGKTKNNWFTLYDAAMLSFTSYTKTGLRIATIFGFLSSAISFIVAGIYFGLKLLFWESFPMGMAPALIGIFFLGSFQLFFIGFLGEYIMNMNLRIMNRPLVIEEKRINF